MKALLILVLLFALTQGNLLNGCISQFNASMDYFPDKIHPAHADDFTVQYFSYYKLVNNLRTGESIVLYQCGAPNSSLPVANKTFAVPLNRVAIDETVTVTFFELLGLRTTIKYIDTTYLNSPCILKLAQEGSIQNFESTWGNATIRAMQIADVDIVFGGTSFSSNPKIVSQSASQDPGTLHRAEWIEYVALFFNAEKLASEISAEFQEEYECHVARMKAYSNTTAVAVVSFFGGTWTVSKSIYLRQYVTDAGGTFLSPNKTSYSGNLGDFQDFLKTVDILVDESYYAPGTDPTVSEFLSKANISNVDVDKYKFLTNKQIWREDKTQNENGGLAWFENSLALPSLVLEDFIWMLHPQYHGSYNTTWLRNIFRNDTLIFPNVASCVDTRAPLSVDVDHCQMSTTLSTSTRTLSTSSMSTMRSSEMTTLTEDDSGSISLIVSISLLLFLFY